MKRRLYRDPDVPLPVLKPIMGGMTLEKAIEIQTIHNDHNPNYTDKEREEAHQLGIEALKRIVYLRLDMDTPHWMTLPGEIKEVK